MLLSKKQFKYVLQNALQRKKPVFLRGVQEGLSKAEKAAGSNEVNREFVRRTKDICDTCKENGAGMPALFNLMSKIFPV